ncbi:hypothetical protein ACFSTC_39160 [Nonomuraea ferruginea]
MRVLHSLGCVVFAVIAMLAFWTGSAAGELPDQSLTLALMAGWVGIATVLSLAPWLAAAGGRTGVPRRRRVTGGLVGALAGVPVGVLGGLTGLALTGGRAFGPGFAVVAGGHGGTGAGRRDRADGGRSSGSRAYDRAGGDPRRTPHPAGLRAVRRAHRPAAAAAGRRRSAAAGRGGGRRLRPRLRARGRLHDRHRGAGARTRSWPTRERPCTATRSSGWPSASSAASRPSWCSS